MNYKLVIGAVAVAALLNTAQAATFTGGIWLVPEATSQNAVIGNISGAANITFTLSPGAIDMSASTGFLGLNPAGYTEAAWLASQNTSHPGSLGNIVGATGMQMDDRTTATLMEISGWVAVTAGETWTIQHDDGVSLYVNGVQMSGLTAGPTSGPVPETTGAWGGGAGTYFIQLVYGENSGSPAMLIADLGTPLNQPVPDGGTTVALLGMGLAGLAGLARRVRAS